MNAEGRVVPVPPAVLAQSFATAPGGAPFGPVDVVNDRDPTGPQRNGMSASASTGRLDYNLDGANCPRDVIVDKAPGARRVQAGIREFLGTGNLHGLPTIILQGRNDDRVPVAFSSCPYLALNSLAEGDATRLRYLEMTKAEQFQLSVRGFDTRFVPLFLYRLRALDTMWAHLTAGAPLPESQVVRTSPRGGEPGSAPALEASNVPTVPTQAAIPDRILVRAGRVDVLN